MGVDNGGQKMKPDRLAINIAWLIVTIIGLVMLSGAIRDRGPTKREARSAAVITDLEASRRGVPPATVAIPLAEPKPEPKVYTVLPPVCHAVDTQIVPGNNYSLILVEDGSVKWSPRKATATAASPQK